MSLLLGIALLFAALFSDSVGVTQTLIAFGAVLVAVNEIYGGEDE